MTDSIVQNTMEELAALKVAKKTLESR